jgi:hypothetical protein
MNTKSNISSSSLSFHETDDTLPIIIKSYEKYGVLEFTSTDCNIYDGELVIMFTLDSSASMGDCCTDGRTKMHHSIFTMTRIVESLLSSNVDIKMAVNHFSCNVINVLDFTKLTSINKDNIISIISDIKPNGSTNMEAALIDSNNRITKEMTSHDKTKYIQIFMTDGEATIGNKNNNVLSELVPVGVSNIFIGYGITHDASMLSTLGCAQPNGEYRFIDEIENSGLIYGEILHNILYDLLENPSITVMNSHIYNWTTNEWVSELKMSNIAANTKRDFHIKTKNIQTENVEIKLYSHTNGVKECLQTFVPERCNGKNNLVSFAFKLRTLELLYEARRITEQSKNQVLCFNAISMTNDNLDRFQYIKIKLSAFMKSLNKFINANELDNDVTMKSLQDDIYVCYSSINTPYSVMYAIARQTSQGNQRAYSTSTNLNHRSIAGETISLNSSRKLSDLNRNSPFVYAMPVLQRQNTLGLKTRNIDKSIFQPHINTLNGENYMMTRQTSAPASCDIKNDKDNIICDDMKETVSKNIQESLTRNATTNKPTSVCSITSNENDIDDPFKKYNILQSKTDPFINNTNKSMDKLMRQISG